MFDLLMFMAHKQSSVTVMHNKCRYSSEIAVFDMSTVILQNTFKTTTSLVDTTVNETLSMKRCDSFCHSVIIAVFSNFTVLNFCPWQTKSITVSMHGMNTKLLWVNFKMLHIRNASILYISSVRFARYGVYIIKVMWPV